MILPEITYNLSRLSESLQEYGRLSGKTEEEVVAKQGGKLAWNIYAGLRALAPGKGSVRAERLAALAAGEGVHVRDAVMREIGAKYNATTSVASGKTFLAQRKGRKVVAMATEIERNGKRLNLQALAVERELTIRETARGFASIATPRPVRAYANALASSGFTTDTVRQMESRYGFVLSLFNVKLSAEKKYAELRWLGRHGEYQDAVLGLSKPRQQKVLNDAIIETNEDIRVYITRKQREDAERTGLN